MIKISKKERDYLVNECEVPCGENGVSRTLGKGTKKHYFLTESKRCMRLLNEYRNSRIVQ